MKRHRLFVVALASLISLGAIVLLGWSVSGSGRAEEGAPILPDPVFPPTPTVAPPPAAQPRVAGAQLAADGFDSPDALTKWEIVDPDGTLPEDRSVWSIVDGALVQNRTAAIGDPSIQETMAMVGNPQWSGYTISADVYDLNNLTFGLVARRQGKSFYRFRIIAAPYDGSPKLALEKVIDGVVTPLATRDGPGYAQRQWHTIAMSVAGSHIRVTLDGALAAEADDTALSSGQAGLYTRALGGIRFDNVSVTAP